MLKIFLSITQFDLFVPANTAMHILCVSVNTNIDLCTGEGATSLFRGALEGQSGLSPV